MPNASNTAMPATTPTTARKIFSKKRPIVRLVAISSLFSALRSKRRHTGAAIHAPQAIRQIAVTCMMRANTLRYVGVFSSSGKTHSAA